MKKKGLDIMQGQHTLDMPHMESTSHLLMPRPHTVMQKRTVQAWHRDIEQSLQCLDEVA
jgi:hypothetical protein